ncbi:MAG: hypothetical protein E7554_05365 [Ruminococcaceae bacterium]|nr:hypothetical protein [Oscillospiraceae bacterium]
MKKLISLMLAALCCCFFTAAASAESETPDAEAGTQPTVTEPAQPSEPIPVFAGTIRLEHENLPTNKPVTVTVVTEGGTLSQTEVIRWRVYKGTVSEADADPNVQWMDYSAPFEVEANMKVEAAVFSADGVKITAASGEITCIDTDAPTAPALQSSNTEWTKDPVTVTLSGGEDAQSGLLRLEYRLGAEGAWSEYTDAISVTSRTAVYARSVDVAGNTSEPVVLDVNNFDTTAPDVTKLSVKVSAAGTPVIAETGAFSKYYGSEVTVTVDGAADAESGVKTYQYQAVSGTESVAEDKWLTYDPEKKPVIPGDFCGYVHARAVDAVGNCSASVSSEGFVVDITPPVVENLKLSETAVTGNRVIVTFNVKDNYWLETVTVNGIYAGVYASSFTAFRNDDYLIVAVDKVGNRTEQLVQITNINTTPFTLLDTWKGMNPQDFTPASWSVAEKAANELQNLITVEAPQAQIESAAGQLLTALEGLESRGDGTLSRELIGRIREYDSELYTESSWNRVEEGIAALESCLDDPASTQESVDNSRRALEQLVAELVKRADFTNLDRLIAQCERMDVDGFSKESKLVFNEALDEAIELSRTDSGQEAADAAYQKLLEAMGALEVSDKAEFNFTPLVFVILGLLIVATASALFIVRMRAKEKLAALEESDEEADEEAVEKDNSIGDIHFTDESETDDSRQSPYIGAPDEDALTGNDSGSYIGGRKQN